MSYECNKCRHGYMKPVASDDESEYTDTFECDKCGYQSLIPSGVIILSQLLSAIIGAGLTGYLLLIHVSKMMTAFQFNDYATIWKNLPQAGAATVFIAGFIFILYKAFNGFLLRKRFVRSK